MKCKQLLSVILMLCMIASSVVSFAAPVYDAKYECSPVSFGYENGGVWTDAVALEGGKAISAKVTAKTTGEKENMVFSVFVYDDGKMVDCEIVTKEVNSDGADFKASADVPADTEGCHVVAMLWNNFYDMDMICDSAIYPSSSTKLRSLYIDGVAAEGFDPDVTEYTYAIDPNAESYPEITWEATDSSAKVSLFAPKSFPGISTVSVEAADGQKTEYKIKYESTIGDIVSNIGGAGTGITYIKGGMVVGGPAYNDRPNYGVTAIGDSTYEGADMIQASIAWQSDDTFKGAATVDWITFDVSRGVTVKVLKSDNGATAHFIEEGYTLETSDLETGFVQTTTNAIKNHKVAMSKHYNAGEKVKIPNGKSSTTYLVAIIHDPIGYVPEGGEDVEPEEPVDESLMLSSLSVDGVAISDFEAKTTEYDYVLSAEQLQAENAPEVTYTLADQTSTAVVTTPNSFPGSAVVTVTNAQDETAEYVINYDGRNLVTNITPDVEVATAAVFVPGGIVMGGRVASDRMVESQWAIRMLIPQLEGQDSILTPVDGWIDVVNNFSFNLNRKAVITVLQNKTNMLSKYEGFTPDADTTSNKLVIGNKNGTGQSGNDIREYTFMASKEFEAGKLTLPYTKPNMPSIIALKYAPWANASAPDVSLNLNSISIDGVAVEDFDGTVNTYEVALTDAQMAAKDAPEVTYTLADGTSSAVVEGPTSFPGIVKITVTNAESQTKTYTVKYTAEVDLALNAAAGDRAPQPEFAKNFSIGDRTFADRPTNFLVTEINDESLIGKARVLYALGWKNDYETQYHTAFTGEVIDWITFTATRDMTVSVYETSPNDSDYAGFTKETSTTPYVVAQASSNGDLKYVVKYSKTYNAGDTVALPNCDASNRIGMAVIDWPSWGEELGGDKPVIPDDPEEPGVEIMSIKDGKESIVVIVHDDGDYNTATYLNEILGANNLKASVGLIAGRIDDADAIKWQNLFDDGVLNAESHSMTHTYMGQDNTKAESAMVNGTQMDIPVGKMETEIVGSQAKIRELFPEQKALVYIRPGVGTITDMDGNPLSSTTAMAMEMMKDTYIAARVTGRTAFTKQGVDTIPPTDYYGMYSIMPGNTTTAEEIMASVDEAVENNGILVFCFHGIDETGSTPNTTRKSETDKVFNTLGEYAAEGKIWVPFYDEAVKYMKETESAEVSVEENGDAIELTVTDDLENAIYNYPITIKTEVPSNWAKVMLTQGARCELVESFTEGGKTYVYANVIPDGGVASIERTTRTGNYATLSDIKLDGESIAYFDSDKFNYTVYVDPADLTYPEVTFTVNDGAEAEVTNPVSYPGEATITVTENGKENVYKITYVVSELLEDLKAADSTVTQPKYVPGGMSVGALAYVDRPQYDIDAINDERFVGYDTILTGIGWQNNESFKSSTYTPWITFKTNREVEVTILKTNNIGNANLVADGYTLETSGNANGFVYVYTNADKKYMYAYTKTYDAGETVSIPNAMTNITYLVALKFPGWSEDGEEPPAPGEPAAVKSISVDGVALQNFDAETLEYNVTLTDSQLASDTYPEVTYELNDNEAAAVVTNPVSFPGFAEVKVTDSEGEKTYKINYLVPDIAINMSALAPEATPIPVIEDSMTIGAPAFVGRTTFPIEAINDDDVEGALWMKMAIGWKNDTADYRDVYMGNQIGDWVNFEAKRGMVVTFYEDVTTNTPKFNYWTTETSAETPYIVGTAATPLKYIVKHQRYFAPGETVNLPNAYGDRVPTVTIKYLGWGEEAPELDVTIPEVRKISSSDLVAKVTKGDGINVTEGQWSGVTDVNSTKYQLSKEFADITEPTEISITADKIDKGYGIIVVAPLDSEADDKNVIVNADGSKLQWTEDSQVVADYAYTNGGDEDFDADNATFGRYNSEAVTFSGGTAYVYEKMHNSDDMYITGSKLGWNRNPYTGELHWTGLPDDYIGCNYIVVDFNTGFDSGEKTFTFTVDRPVKIWVHSKASNMTVTDTVSEDEWTASQYAVRRRYQNVLDHLSCAYMLKKGYINESNIAFDGKVGDTNGVRFNRYDVYEKLKADCGGELGWAIDPEKVEATGFTNSINTYRYEEYLEAWVD